MIYFNAGIFPKMSMFLHAQIFHTNYLSDRTEFYSKYRKKEHWFQCWCWHSFMGLSPRMEKIETSPKILEVKRNGTKMHELLNGEWVALPWREQDSAGSLAHRHSLLTCCTTWQTGGGPKELAESSPKPAGKLQTPVRHHILRKTMHVDHVL